VVRADGTAAAVATGGDLLGVFEHPSTVVDEITLAPGDALVCFTDGVTERRDDSRMLGEEGVLAALSGAGRLDAAGLARRLDQAVSTFTTAPARDDVAILVIRPRPRAG
jgi:serine phosphatase RsbU (regulator of sigma subunit)